MSTRNRPVPCRYCGPNSATWNGSGVCDGHTAWYLASLVTCPTQITEPLLGEPLTEADTAAAFDAWLSGASRYGGAA